MIRDRFYSACAIPASRWPCGRSGARTVLSAGTRKSRLKAASRVAVMRAADVSGAAIEPVEGSLTDHDDQAKAQSIWNG